MFGLTEREINIITQKLAEDSLIERALIFGSRAMGNYKKGSDIDMAIIGKNITERNILRLYGVLSEQTNLPYEFDLINYNTLRNLDLKDHIDKIGVCIWERK